MVQVPTKRIHKGESKTNGNHVYNIPMTAPSNMPSTSAPMYFRDHIAMAFSIPRRADMVTFRIELYQHSIAAARNTKSNYIFPLLKIRVYLLYIHFSAVPFRRLNLRIIYKIVYQSDFIATRRNITLFLLKTFGAKSLVLSSFPHLSTVT